MDSDKQLYFIAIVPPSPVFEQVQEFKHLMASIYGSDAALRSPAHLTLHMPFLWKEKKEKVLIDAMLNFADHQKTFEIKLNGFGCFEPRVIYVNVEENNALKKMQANLMDHVKINLNLFNANYRQLPFHPHITIAFRNLKKTIFPQAWGEFGRKQYVCSFLVSSLCLLKHNGKAWNIFKEFSFNS